MVMRKVCGYMRLLVCIECSGAWAHSVNRRFTYSLLKTVLADIQVDDVYLNVYL